MSSHTSLQKAGGGGKSSSSSSTATPPHPPLPQQQQQQQNIKSRFTTSDVRAMVRDLRAGVVGLRIANIFDINDKTYIVKLTGTGSEKINLLLESGIRFHTTKFIRDKPNMPSPFTMKLRRFIRTKRLEDITQLGGDRIVDFKFGSSDNTNHIILELYANGNIILTNHDYEILALLRSHEFDEENAIRVGEIYPVSMAVNRDIADSTNRGIMSMNSVSFLQWAQDKDREIQAFEAAAQSKSKGTDTTTASAASAAGGGAGSKKDKSKRSNLRQLLLNKDSGVSMFGPEVLDECVFLAKLTPGLKISELEKEENIDKLAMLLQHLQEAKESIKLLDSSAKQAGFILYKEFSSPSSADLMRDYVDFLPKLFRQYVDGTSAKVQELASFDEAVDEYFCKLEEQKLLRQLMKAEEETKNRIEKVKMDQENMIRALERTQQKMENSAMIVEAFADSIDKALLVINSALGSGMTWEDVDMMVSSERAKGNPIASLIKSLRLDKNQIVLHLRNLFRENDDDEDVSSSEDEFLDITIDISMSAYQNSTLMFSSMKQAKAKEAKTIQHAQRVGEHVKEQAIKALNAQKLKSNLNLIRKVHWFEKFNWFISTEGYLVLSGRDAGQNEVLVKRYLRKSDIYVHADIAGAASCIVRAKTRDKLAASSDEASSESVSPFAIQEAATMTVCRSRAWNSRAGVSAWWVYANQVSKSAPSGEYLTTGSFMIYGKKNFLPPSALEMGFGIMFRLDDESVSRHIHERRDKSMRMEEEESVVSDALDRYGLDFEGLGIGDVARSSSAAGGASRFIGSSIFDGRDSRGDILASAESISSPFLSSTTSKAAGKKSNGAIPNGHNISSSNSGGGNNVEENCSKEEEENKEGEEEYDVDIDDEDDKYGQKVIEKVVETRPVAQSTKPAPSKLSDADSNSQSLDTKTKQVKQNGNSSKGKKAAVAASEDSNKKIVVQLEPSDDNKGANPKKKVLNKKKARRYAEQDDEDRELAMMALGHINPANNHVVKQKEDDDLQKQKDIDKRKEKAGVHLIRGKFWENCADLDASVKTKIQSLFEDKILNDNDLDLADAKSLSACSTEQILEILVLFADGCIAKGTVNNKSGFLAGIVRRFTKANSGKDGGGGGGKSKQQLSSSELKGANEKLKQDQSEIEQIMDEEGIYDEEEGKQADEVEKLTGTPFADDILLCAVPVCGPYSAMRHFKFRAKLTPGVAKKGKVAKQAVDLFAHAKDCTEIERTFMRALTDPEMVAVTIGDVKLSMPGIQEITKQINKSKGKIKSLNKNEFRRP